jgi:hypothetical protein
VRVQLVPQVVFDGERLPPRDQAPAEHEDTANEPEDDDRGDPQ